MSGAAIGAAAGRGAGALEWLIHVSNLSALFWQTAGMGQLQRISGAVARRTALAALVVLAGAFCAQADPHDHEAARLAVKRGEIQSLADILNLVAGKLPGEVTAVKIERKAERWLYEFRVVDGQGRLFEVYVDGRSGEIARIKEK